MKSEANVSNAWGMGLSGGGCGRCGSLAGGGG